MTATMTKRRATPEPVEPRLLTIPQAATYVNVCRETVYRYIREGTFPGVVRVGGQLRIDKVALDKWIEARAA